MNRIKKCKICEDNYRAIDIKESYYFGSSGYSDCCYSCRIMTSPSKSELEELIPQFVSACGFIPNSDANPVNHKFTSRIPQQKKRDIFWLYGQMGGLDHVKSRFGSWFKALAKANVLPNGVLPTSRGVRCIALDGHECHSLDEQRIDNWLYEHGIPHEREPNYPEHSRLNPTGRKRADWKVGDIFIEYFGLINEKNYEKKAIEKITLAHLTNIELIVIDPSEINNLYSHLSDLIQL